MDKFIAIKIAEIYEINARIEGMKIENRRRESLNVAHAYPEGSFFDEAERLSNISIELMRYDG